MKTEQEPTKAAITLTEVHGIVNAIRAEYGLLPIINRCTPRKMHASDICHRKGRELLFRREAVIKRAHADAKRISQKKHTMKTENKIDSTHTLTMTGSAFARLEQLCTRHGIDLATLASSPPKTLELPDTTHFTKEAAELYDRLQQHATLLDACATLTMDQRSEIHGQLQALAACLDALDNALLAATSYRDNVKKWLQIAPADPSEI